MGATVSQIGKTPDEVLEKLKEQILIIYPRMQPDSEVAMFNSETKETKVYEVLLEGTDEKPEVVFKERHDQKINLATSCAIQVTRGFSEMPKHGEWVGCIHFG